jgi:hypothetical protein
MTRAHDAVATAKPAGRRYPAAPNMDADPMKRVIDRRKPTPANVIGKRRESTTGFMRDVLGVGQENQDRMA